MRFVIAAILVFTAATAWGGEWVKIAEDKDGNAWYTAVDALEFNTTDNTARAWFKFVLSKNMTSSIQHVIFNCNSLKSDWFNYTDTYSKTGESSFIAPHKSSVTPSEGKVIYNVTNTMCQILQERKAQTK